MFRCLNPGCPVECGTRRRPNCAERMLCRALFLLLAGVLTVSLAVGFFSLRAAFRSASRDTPPLARPQAVELVC